MHDLKVSVAEIIGRPGEYRDVSFSKPVAGVEVALARLGQRPVNATLRLESVVEGILVTGRAAAAAQFECARCLKPFPASVEVELCELFATPGHMPEDGDAYAVRGSEIDLEPMLRDSLTLALPFKPLCDESCRGMCARCGRELASGECTCTEETGDPRWADLDALRDKLQAR